MRGFKSEKQKAKGNKAPRLRKGHLIIRWPRIRVAVSTARREGVVTQQEWIRKNVLGQTRLTRHMPVSQGEWYKNQDRPV